MFWCGVPGGAWETYSDPVDVVAAFAVAEVLPALQEVERRVRGGLHAAGFIAYEAAPGFDPALRTHARGTLPLLWFGLFGPPGVAGPADPGGAGEVRIGPASFSLDRAGYELRIAQIKRLLAAGETYQVNFTMRLAAPFSGEPLALFLRLHAAQQSEHSAFIETPDFAVCSASPELFFLLDGDHLSSKPMKGTARRGATPEQDAGLAAGLRRCGKNRAENLMIVDMVRNDMGRIARPGSVRVPALFDVERYPTLLQMTSTVSCATSAPVAGIVRALFPCASVTGAPKVRTMQLIRGLEDGCRGVYTGCVGRISPGRRARFNVAIRTAVVDKAAATVEYGVGGGIVADSDAAAEFRECLLKAEVFRAAAAEFSLLETMLWEPHTGLFLLDAHLARLAASAAHFGFPFDEAAVRRELDAGRPAAAARQPCRARLLLDRRGRAAVEWRPVDGGAGGRPWRVRLADEPVDRGDVFLAHKTTQRSVYERARAAAPGCDDVILWNEAGELTEGTLANLVIRAGGRLWTPPLASGLLPGVFRGWLLAHGRIGERVLTKADLGTAQAVFLINSVRRWIPATLRYPLR